MKSFLAFWKIWKGINFNSRRWIKILVWNKQHTIEIINRKAKRWISDVPRGRESGWLSPHRVKVNYPSVAESLIGWQRSKQSMSSPLCVSLLYQSHDVAAAGRAAWWEGWFEERRRFIHVVLYCRLTHPTIIQNTQSCVDLCHLLVNLLQSVMSPIHLYRYIDIDRYIDLYLDIDIDIELHYLFLLLKHETEKVKPS